MKLIWLREDLRLHDNPALYAAAKAGKEENESVMAVFLWCDKTFVRHDKAPVRLEFTHQNLITLNKASQTLNIDFYTFEVPYFSDCAAFLSEFCRVHEVSALYLNRQYELDEMRRDTLVTAALNQDGIKVAAYDEQTILPPGSVLSQKDTPIKIFTPFRARWLKVLATRDETPLPLPKAQTARALLHSTYTAKAVNLEKPTSLGAKLFCLAGEKAAKVTLEHFLNQHLGAYHEKRDYPALEATSRLSPYLAQGVISARVCLARLCDAIGTRDPLHLMSLPGPQAWLSELVWREFYKHLVYFFPHVCRHEPFKKEYATFPWHNNPGHFEAWCEGKTGFPIVDAAMRALNKEGWMHNRLRMVTAMFLCKILLIDWRWGERYFMQHLIDGDFAANNGGWQWSASTGTDAVPYFRIFNFTNQSEKFDPDGTFIRTHCPELKSFDAKSIHAPHERDPERACAVGYPQPIVDYATRRKEVVRLYQTC